MTAPFADAWVTRRGPELLLGGRPFRFVGFNAYDLPFKADAAEVDATLRAASRLGLRVVRTWAFNSNPGSAYAFYKPDGSPNEEQFLRVDVILESARRHGLKVILVFENYWPDYGGIATTAARFGVAKLEFFSDPRCRAAYRGHVANLVTRVNAISGRPYLDDPTLFAWELMNEPRIDAREDPTPDGRLGDATGARLGAWLADTSRHVKSLDPRHLVGPGAEGHGFRGWGATTEGWGADPLGVMDHPDLDFFTFHPYLNESWARHSAAEARRLVSEFVADGHARGKPVLMEEWGINQTEPLCDPSPPSPPSPLSPPGAEGRLIRPGEASFAWARRDWYRLLLEAFRQAGGDGSLVWMLQTGVQEPHFGITLDIGLGPGVGAAPTDLALLEVLASEARVLAGGGGGEDPSE
jgi:mannan endo-1,4-beta-mannosidase